MIPSSIEGKALYVSTRDMFNRWRRDVLRRSGGDMDALKAHVLDHLGIHADFAQFRESVDFAEQEGLLSPEAKEAADNAIAWGEQLQKILGEK